MLSTGILGQITLSSSQTTASIDFESTASGISEGVFAGVGFSPLPLDGQLDSDAFSVLGFSDGDLGFGGSAVSGDLARGSISGGGTSTGGLYALADVPNPGGSAIAFQPGGSDFTPGALILRIVNQDLNEILVQLTVSYDIYELNDAGRSSSLDFSYSTDGVNFIPLPMLGHASTEAADASPMYVKIGSGGPSRTAAIGPISIAPSGGEILLRWQSDDLSGTGSRDEIAIDNISIEGVFLGTTNADGMIEGTVLTSKGDPLSFVAIRLSGKSLGEERTVISNHFGRFRFEGLATGNTYVVQALSGRYSFQMPVQTVFLDQDLQRITFTGEPTGSSAKEGL